jgi:hypothetical protein
MSRKTRCAAVASLALGLSLAGMTAAGARDIQSVFAEDLPAITGDVEGGLGSLLGDGGLLGGILGGTEDLLGGTDDLLGGVLGALGLADEPDVSIQPVPPMDGSLTEPKVGGGLLDNLFGVASITESLAGHI